MTNHYQLIIIGAANPLRQEILDTFFQRTKDLGIESDKIIVIRPANFAEYRAVSPAFCIYFGDSSGTFHDDVIISRLQDDAKLILPVVDDLAHFPAQIPPALRPINGFALGSSLKIEQLVSVVLEGLSLLRLSRRLFISYKRDESRPVAVQLFEELEAAGFHVFLDTHSIRPAQAFQAELWHQLVDTDVVVLLNTPKFLNSEWTTQELARANAMSVGILQVMWPGYQQQRDAQLSVPLMLHATDFGNPHFAASDQYLSPDAVARVVSTAESLRARSLAARQFNMVKEFIAIVSRTGAPVTVEPAKYLVVTKRNGDLLIIVPTIGIPQAFSYYQADLVTKTIETGKVADVYLLYDHLYIRDEWLAHLTWLEQSFNVGFKIKTLKTRAAEVIFPTLI